MMKLFYSDTFGFPLPPGHRFPVEKYALLRQRLLSSNLISAEDMQIPDIASDEQLLRVHSREYLKAVVQGMLDPRLIRRIGLPWSPELVERSRRSVGGTIAAMQSALDEGIGVNLAGGTHHAHRDWGSGFCVFNDVAVAAREAQEHHGVARILIIDCDVHQGDGTAAIFHGDPGVYTFSIHGQSNFPFRKAESDLDIGLENGTGDADYFTALQAALRAILRQRFDLAFYLAGADPYIHDSFGHLALTKEGLRARDRAVFDACLADRLPVVVVLAGGYAPSLDDIADIHQNTIEQALAFERAWRGG